jgi:hypothetical protein
MFHEKTRRGDSIKAFARAWKGRYPRPGAQIKTRFEVCQKYDYISDLKEIEMSSIAENILEHAKSLPEGSVLMAKGLLQFGSRAGVDQALSRLVREGRLVRAARGAYVVPVTSRFGTRPPSVHAVAEGIQGITGEAVEAHGIAAANQLGLTTQVPVRPVYVTAGRSRTIKLGAQILEIQHVPRWQMLMPGRPAGQAIRALAWLGRGNAASALRELHGMLSKEEWHALENARPSLPMWLAQAVSETMTRVG